MEAVLCCLLLAFCLSLFQQHAEATRSGYDYALEMVKSRRSYFSSQHGYSSKSAPSLSGASGFDGINGSGEAGNSFGVYTSGGASSLRRLYTPSTYGDPSAVYPLLAPEAFNGVTAGLKGTFPMPYGCNQCGGEFGSELQLYEHKKFRHPVSSDAHCYLCNVTYSCRRGLMGHLRYKHRAVAADKAARQNLLSKETDDSTPYACLLCRKRYNTENGLRDHMKSHTTDDTTCHLCDRVYSTRAIFKRHMSDVHPEIDMPEPTVPVDGPPITEPKVGPFACDKCGKSYTHKRNLKLHTKSHETLETYCIPCDRTFASKLGYDKHMKSRHPKVARAEKAVESKARDEKRPVKCKICNNGFKNDERLRLHMKSHAGKTNCDICGAKYRCRSALYTHKKKEHQN